MKLLKTAIFTIISVLVFISFNCKAQDRNSFKAEDMIVRIAQIEIYPEHLDEYISILKEESAASVRLEHGVISIFPMFQEDNPTEIRILEIYRNNEAYEAHLQTPHFKHYKKETQEMVKSLKLVDMKPIDAKTMPEIFQKLHSKMK